MTWTTQNAAFTSMVLYGGGRLYVEIRQKDAPVGWGFNVMTPNFGATPIAAGTYNTARDPLSPAMFFEFFGDGRGCGAATARLVIHLIERTPDGLGLESFRASFENHHCEGASPVMQGEIAILPDSRS